LLLHIKITYLACMIRARQILVALLLSQIFSNVFSQDLVVTSKGDSIRCLITEVNSTQVYFTHKTSEGIRYAIMPLGLIKDYKKDFYQGDTSLAAAIASEEKAAEATLAPQVPSRIVTTGYFDLIAKKNGDSLNCEILRELPGSLQYRYKVGGTWMRSEVSRSEVADFRYKWFQASTGRVSNQTVEFSFNIGLGYRTGKAPEGLSADAKDHINGLRSGLALNAGLTFYTPKNIGIGVKASLHNTSQTTNRITIFDPVSGSSYTGTLEEAIRTAFVGPMFRYRNLNAYTGNSTIIGFGLGYLGYTDNVSFTEDFIITGKTVGVVLDFSYDVPIGEAKKNFFGFNISYTAGTLTKYDITVGTITQTIQLEDDEYEDLGRLDFTLGFRFGN
jgi:hypothetical protein